MTPAVNIDSKSVGTVDCYMLYTGYPPVDLGSRSYVIQRTLRKRPASTTKAISNGWRGMTNWTHSWGHGSSSLGSTEVRLDNVPSGTGRVYAYVYPDGSYWGSNALNRPEALAAPSWLRNKCEIDALNKVRNSDFDLGVVLAEAKETARTISSTAERIACEVSNFRRSHSRKIWRQIMQFEGTRRWKEIPSQWLALQYGWKPLLRDVVAGMATLEMLTNKRMPLIHVKGTARHEETRDVTIGGAQGSSQTYKQRWRFDASCSLYFKKSNSTLAALSSLGLINPASIAWEKLPYSFVVDWFAPVGAWISSFTATAGFDFQAGCYSQIAKCNETLREVSTIPNNLGSGWTVYDGNKFSWHEGYFLRDVYLSSPVPGLYVKSPFSAGHVANALALLTQSFK